MIRARLAAIVLLIGLAALFRAGPAMAHDAQPLLIQIDERAPHVFSVRTKLPPSMDGHAAPQVTLGPDCKAIAGEAAPGTVAGSAGEAELIRCPQPLAGGWAEIAFPDFNPSLALVFRYQPLDGPVLTRLQPPDQTRWEVPSAQAERGWLDSALRYLRLGIEHILLGFDHLLFVLCMLLLAGSAHRILLAITGFTAAHSVTLGLAALGVVRPPVAVIEALIALSIVVLAAEVARQDKGTVSWRYPMAVSMTFGLLHGFGFAAALGEIGLPRDQELVSLLAFNLGVELGQIVFVLTVIAMFSAMAHAAARYRNRQVIAITALSVPIAYIVGSLAAFWFIQRTLAF